MNVSRQFMGKRTVLDMMLIIFALGPMSNSAYAQHMADTEIVLCPRGFTEITTQPLDTLQARSLMDCAAQCFQRGDCGSFNYCPEEEEGGEEEVTCQILTNHRIPSCQDLHPAQSSSCQHGFDATVCQNGGTFDGLDCQCPPQFAGVTCQRYIADCMEMTSNGYNSESYNGPYLIQPADSPEPFWVYCQFSTHGWGNWIFRRYGTDVNLTWQDAARGYLGDLPTSSAEGKPRNFFIGLDDLHRLTSQAAYLACFTYDGVNNHSHVDRCTNFTVGPESSSYQVTFGSFQGRLDNPALAWPIFFSTLDHDTNGCANGKGGAGWYGAGCNTFALFGEAGTEMMINGTWTELEKAKLALLRTSEFFETLP